MMTVVAYRAFSKHKSDFSLPKEALSQQDKAKKDDKCECGHDHDHSHHHQVDPKYSGASCGGPANQKMKAAEFKLKKSGELPEKTAVPGVKYVYDTRCDIMM